LDQQDAPIDGQVERFVRCLDQVSNQEALHTSGALSETIWLRQALSGSSC